MTGLAERPSRKPPETRKAATPSTASLHAYAKLPAWRAELSARQAAERRQLIATQAATQRACAGDDFAARARAEIVQAFAHRWAHIRRMPFAERAATAAALHAEQASALSARTRELAAQLRHQQLTAHMQRGSLFAAARKTLSKLHREAWASAAASLRARRPARPTRRKPDTPAP